ncbi:Sedlin [Stereum hirsutum FP-91666 SS1]|uniref:Sedlin n=1 Tax=Stereum hirsutum (strain FP-91666) TaxID=721885 RepID=UPI0004410506|nr:Sedlin [Stereum hirsutum FP-91666 SS1]EIM87790.1 Sedlin [Stereum hirsutum FP-91666 SS1]
MPPPLGLAAVAYVSPQNHPILIRSLSSHRDEADLLKYHYLAHTSLDVIEERIAAAPKGADSYLGFLYAMEEVAVYGYITPLKVKIILALTLSDAIVRDLDVIAIFKALHLAYYQSVSNPFLKLHSSLDAPNDHATLLHAGSSKWKSFRRRVDDVARAVAQTPN